MSKFKVCHIPQIPGKAFEVEVPTLEEALRLEDTLAFYDLFQFAHKIKPDYCNMTFIEEWNAEEGEWEEVDPYTIEGLREAEA